MQVIFLSVCLGTGKFYVQGVKMGKRKTYQKRTILKKRNFCGNRFVMKDTDLLCDEETKTWNLDMIPEQETEIGLPD